jgi:hypothetical protein
MKATILIAAAFAASVNARVIEARQRPTARPTGTPDGKIGRPDHVFSCNYLQLFLLFENSAADGYFPISHDATH